MFLKKIRAENKNFTTYCVWYNRKVSSNRNTSTLSTRKTQIFS